MKMQDKKLKKFKIYKNISNVLFTLTIVFIVIALIIAIGGMIALSNLSDAAIEQAKDFVMINLPFLILPDEIVIPYGVIITFIVALMVHFSLFAFVFKKVSFLFENIYETKTAFTQTTVKILKHISISIFIYVVITFILSVLGSILAPNIGDNIMNYNVELGALLVGFLIYSLSEIFEYGLSLQQDSESIL